jgi:hypothetical protein
MLQQDSVEIFDELVCQLSVFKLQRFGRQSLQQRLNLNISAPDNLLPIVEVNVQTGKCDVL